MINEITKIVADHFNIKEDFANNVDAINKFEHKTERQVLFYMLCRVAGVTQKDVGDIYGYSRVRVAQILAGTEINKDFSSTVRGLRKTVMKIKSQHKDSEILKKNKKRKAYQKNANLTVNIYVEGE